ncbi:MAG: WYL domain-containing transcriptional regulator [Clostridia bacterium]|nr:WYL domain-containing transcriptional regulator [Clostridia bacterium]
MDALEPKKLALLRILQILKTHSDFNHPMTQEEISRYLENDYGIFIERKAISRNLSLLKEAGYEIESGRNGSYLDSRELEDAELRMLIDGVLSSKYITAKHSKDLIEKLCNMSNKYFRSHVKNVYSINDWSKTDNQALFFNIELVDEAIDRKKQIKFDYNKYGLDKKLHRTTTHYVSPYQLILHNQRYYLMAFNERWKNMGYYRLDHITNMDITDDSLTPVTSVEGYKGGIDYKQISTALPYMYTDKPENIEMIADKCIIDQLVDWFGKDIIFTEINEKQIRVQLTASPMAMENWAMQYVKHVEVTKPEKLRNSIKEILNSAQEKYK